MRSTLRVSPPKHQRHRGWLAMLLGLAVLGCRPEPPSTAAPEGSVARHEPATPSEPASGDALDLALDRLADPKTRAKGLADLDRMALAAETDEQRQALAEAIVPALLEIWDDALPQRLTMPPRSPTPMPA